MTTNRIILAGVLGGIVMFFWSYVAHGVLPLGDAGMSELPGEQAVVAAMQSSIGDKPGLYRFPGFGFGDNPTAKQKSEAMNQMAEKYGNNVSGLLIYYPPGTRSVSLGKQLCIEFVIELIEAILLVTLLAQTRITSFVGRVAFVLTAGFFAAIATHLPYWNWDGFPLVFTISQITIQIVAFFCVGLVAALVLGKGTAEAQNG